MKFIWKHFLWFFIFLLFFTKAFNFLDPDFGWHYRMGKIISQSGVPKIDQFSYTMPNFEYIDHEWFTDVLIYKIYNSVGTLGLSLVWCLLAVLTLGISINISEHLAKFKYKNLATFITLVVVSALLLPQFGIRPQVISWFLFSILLYLINYWEKIGRLKYVTPLLFFLWSNMHGGFLLGLVIFATYLFIKLNINKKIKFDDLLILICSILLTFVNPYFINLWKEIFDTFFSNPLRGQIEEWKPFWTGVNILHPFIAILTLVFINLYKNKYKVESLIIFIILLIMSFSALINLPFFAIGAAPILINGLVFLEQKSSSYKLGNIRFKKLLNGLGVLLFLFSVITFIASINGGLKYSENRFYPKSATDYISKNLPKGEIFSNYNWGGYLIWKLPFKKVFIDGRMAHWPDILNLHSQIMSGNKEYAPLFNEYNVDMVLLSNSNSDTKFINRIIGDGWVVVYADKISQVLVKNVPFK